MTDSERGVGVSKGDIGLDRSETHIDNSSRVEKTKDDHSVRTTTITDNSSRHVEVHANDSRQDRRKRFAVTISGIAISGNMVLSVVVVVVMAVVTMAVVQLARDLARGPRVTDADTSGATPAAAPSTPSAPANQSGNAPHGMAWVLPGQGGPGQPTMATQFAIDLTEVSTGAFAAFVAANQQWRWDHLQASAHDGDYLKDWPGGAPAPDRAISYVTWAAADGFCRARGRRLPTEQEWEYAARVAPSGLTSMAGSLWEWTASDSSDRAAPRKVVRGGGWQDPPGMATIEARQFLAPTITAPDLGFRCVQ